MLQLLGDEVPQTPYRGFAPGPHWGTSVPQTPCTGRPPTFCTRFTPLLGFHHFRLRLRFPSNTRASNARRNSSSAALALSPREGWQHVPQNMEMETQISMTPRKFHACYLHLCIWYCGITQCIVIGPVCLWLCLFVGLLPR